MKPLPRPAGISFMDNVIDALCEPASYTTVHHSPGRHAVPMPSVTVLEEIVGRLRAVLYPGYYGYSDINADNMRYHTATNLDKVYRLLCDQINRGHCFICSINNDSCEHCEEQAQEKARAFIEGLPVMRSLLASDVQAAYEGDPAAVGHGETIFCYPSIKAVTNYRIAHALHRLDVHIIPRIITEMAHSDTGIDIHPGAQIGKSFFIDHGTGTVIGATCIIGNSVRLYQGVTLGAKSFPSNEEGKLVRGIPRHPQVEDDVIVYSGATILGRVTIGKGAVIGGNVWLTEDVAPGSRVLQKR